MISNLFFLTCVSVHVHVCYVNRLISADFAHECFCRF